MALSANSLRNYDLGDINEFGVKASSVIYLGSAVGSSAGYARALVAGDTFLGFALEAATGTSTDGAVSVRVRTRGHVQLAVDSVAVTDIGKPVYASDDGTFTLTQSTNSYIGRVHRFISTGVCIVAFDASHVGGTTGIAAIAGTLTGTVDGTLADVAAIALSTGNTYTDTAVNSAVNTAITAMNLQLKELQTKVNELINAQK